MMMMMMCLFVHASCVCKLRAKPKRRQMEFGGIPPTCSIISSSRVALLASGRPGVSETANKIGNTKYASIQQLDESFWTQITVSRIPIYTKGLEGLRVDVPACRMPTRTCLRNQSASPWRYDARFFIARIISISVRSLDKKIEILDKAG
jgi:hypothetical protein